jgi:FGGY-family pentulose kinase
VAEGPYLMGVDFGTGSVRVGIFDSEGTPVAFHVVEYETHHPRPGWAEQYPDEWWSCLVASSRGAMAKSRLSPEEIVGISVDATASTVLMIDEKDKPMRPAIMWMDVRAADQACRLSETGDPALKYNGYGAVSAEWMPPKALWLKENEPEAFNNAKHICDCGDWLIHRLTGNWAASINVASTKWYYDRDEGGYPENLYSAVGLDEVLDKFPQDILDLGSVVGGLRREAAWEMGLKDGTPVAQGGVDAFVGALGLGVVEPARLALITGSSHVIIGQAASPLHGQGFFGSFTDAVIPGQYTLEGGQVSTGSIVTWFKNQFAGEAAAEAKERGVGTYEVLTELACGVPIGSEGLIVLDYFQGNRSPYTDPLARGMIWGLSLSHGPGHIFRAIMEGICYGTEHVFRTMGEHGFKPTETVVAGGPTKSKLWMQMHADVSNVPISLTREGESAVLGSAMLAAVGAGVYPDIQTTVQNMVHTERTIEPDSARHEEYSFYMDRYIETYPQMRELMHRTVRHIAGGSLPADAAGA